ncbi:MAG: InlB B-repeat-containing protein, partial [Spirochaetes bacterium]|nr:InlB B-repeat-containing protein [Spirochaetota bacterium]
MKRFAILCLSFFLILILSGCSGSNPGLLPPAYTITYDANGADAGIAPLDSNSYFAGQTATVLNNTGNLVKTGYNFNGWNTAADGTGDTCIAGQTLSIGSTNVVLYAIWAIDIYIVTYEGNGSDAGTVPLDTNSYIEGQTVTVLDNTGSLLKTGYTFSGWNTIADGSGESYTAGETFPMGLSNVVMYAMWTNNIYTVTYDGNGSTGGTVPTDSAAYIQGQTVTVLDNTGSLLKTGYTFTGWNTAADGSGDTYISSQTFSMALSNVTLYAKWDVLINRQWYSITSSADGTKLAALGFEQIYTSTDSGATWTARDSSRQWNSITSSADGTKLAATVVGGQIYT